MITFPNKEGKMSTYFIENYCDEADFYTMDQHKYIHLGHSGKGRTKRESRQHTNGYDPNGHTRKTTQKLMNNKDKQRHGWTIWNKGKHFCPFLTCIFEGGGGVRSAGYFTTTIYLNKLMNLVLVFKCCKIILLLFTNFPLYTCI